MKTYDAPAPAKKVITVKPILSVGTTVAHHKFGAGYIAELFANPKLSSPWCVIKANSYPCEIWEGTVRVLEVDGWRFPGR